MVVQVCIGCSLKVTRKHLPEGVRDPEEGISTGQFVFSVPAERKSVTSGVGIVCFCRGYGPVDDVNQADIARSCTQPDEEAHHHQLVVGLDKGCP